VLGIKHIVPAALTALTMASFPVTASTYAYMFCAYQYFFSLAAASFAAYEIRKCRILPGLAGMAAIAMGMGCYQAYFAWSAALLVMSMIKDICEDRWKHRNSSCIIAGLWYVLCLSAGMILYMIILKIMLFQTGTELSDYQGINEMGSITWSVLKERIVTSYSEFFGFYANDTEVFHAAFPKLAAVCLVTGYASLVFIVIQKKFYRKPIILPVLTALAVIIPVACNLVYIMTDVSAVHMVMRYPMVLPLLIPAVVADGILSLPSGTFPVSRICAAVVCVLLIMQTACAYEFILITNRAYFSMDMTYENMYAFYTKLTAKIELQEGYTHTSTIAMIGEAEGDSHVPDTHLTGVKTGDAALNIYTRNHFLSYFLGSDYKFADSDTCMKIRYSDKFKAMPSYPDAGSIDVIYGVIVVKLSDC
jgi:hypothetical protein